jgi:hypothetical protein
MRRGTRSDHHLRHPRLGIRIPLALLRPVTASVVAGAAIFCMVALPTQVAGAASDIVLNCNSSGSGSLPAVVASAQSGDTIIFSIPPSCTTITLASTITIGSSVTIDGPGPGILAVSGNSAFAVFQVNGGVSATIAGITVENGIAGADGGGGIVNEGTLRVIDSTVSNNSASGDEGGGILNEGALSVVDSTVSNNSATTGGGIDNLAGSVLVNSSTLSGNSATMYGGGINSDASLSVVDSTVSNNSANDGGGIENEGTLSLTASTLSGNSAVVGGALDNDGAIDGGVASTSVAATILANSVSGGNCQSFKGSITDAGYNLDDHGSCGFSSVNNSLSGVKPLLGTLQNNGGPTETQAPALGSPALDQIPSGTTGNGMALCPGTDQRGLARPQQSECDIGSVELVVGPYAITSPDNDTAEMGTFFSFTVDTIGSPAAKITKKGKLPRNVRLADISGGEATISGTPQTSGSYPITITAIFGKGKAKQVVTQAFTLTVVSP